MIFQNQKQMLESIDMIDTPQIHMVTMQATELRGVYRPFMEYSGVIKEQTKTAFDKKHSQFITARFFIRVIFFLLYIFKLCYVYSKMPEASAWTIFWEASAFTLPFLLIMYSFTSFYNTTNAMHYKAVLLREGILSITMCYDRLFTQNHFLEKIRSLSIEPEHVDLIQAKRWLQLEFEGYLREVLGDWKNASVTVRTYERVTRRFFNIIRQQYNSNDHFKSNHDAMFGIYDEDYQIAKDKAAKARRRR